MYQFLKCWLINYWFIIFADSNLKSQICSHKRNFQKNFLKLYMFTLVACSFVKETFYLLHHGNRVRWADSTVKDFDEGWLEGRERLGVVRAFCIQHQVQEEQWTIQRSGEEWKTVHAAIWCQCYNSKWKYVQYDNHWFFFSIIMCTHVCYLKGDSVRGQVQVKSGGSWRVVWAAASSITTKASSEQSTSDLRESYSSKVITKKWPSLL